ncbi:MAG: NTP transferase domain-containing protein [Syntrophotaleaceae bacterium]
MDRPRVAAIIQARMGSTRLPGKVLLPLAGRPVLWHIIHRLRQCRTLDRIAVTTSDRPDDDVLVAWCETEGVPVFRGPEDNVLQRFAIAAESLDPEVILRVTGDAPLIDPTVIDLLVNTLLREDADYCVGDSAHPTIHEGFSPFQRRALSRLLTDASRDPVAVEHVTAYLACHPEQFSSCLCVLAGRAPVQWSTRIRGHPDDLEVFEPFTATSQLLAR